MTDLDVYAASFDGEPGYLDWAAFGPISPVVRGEVQADADLLGTGRRSSIDLVSEHEREAREAVAALLRTDAEHVTLQPSTTYGLMHAFYGLRGGLLISSAEFPALTVAGTRAASLGRVDLQLFDPEAGFVTPEAVQAALTDETTAVAVSLVDFRTGYCADLAAIRDVIGDRLLIVDAIQGFGVVDADYEAADVVCGHGYKWLRAGRGTGFASFSDIARERIEPVLSGFAAVEGGALPLDTVPGPAPSAQAFGVSAPDHLAAARLASATREIADVGVEKIDAAIAVRATEIIELADAHGIPVVTPREPERRAGIIALAPEAQHAGSLSASLANHGVVFTTRAGLVRLAAHAGTGPDTMQMLRDALDAFASSHVA
ncbi:aminotransferase class V-fold PLP-dependent enzyme [Microbacterium sp. ASV49]|uniref:Aminotransferase class V-fold PLP-dependent enzyme n=1 Tax=Microbacterium candidum TaxID=3041922 RepID=A0ABT7N236_9MICO|nr:aminotransferase class V-fold PLP-dependent enzyme [Microbacterium sp. ASV49]MDL9980774.1 aminotransferase class V-fold PLP-dependent enzyme [Microbacterium sp. ASV49]